MKKRDYQYIFDEFKMMCPWAVSNVESWRPGDEKEIIVTMHDGSVISYDYILRAFKSAPSEEALLEMRRPTDETSWRQQFSVRLYKLMQIRGYTQEDLSYETGITQGSITRYVNGLSTPSAWAITRIARVLKCTETELTNFY